MLKFVFCIGLTGFICLAFGQHMNENGDSSIMLATKMWPSQLISGGIKLMQMSVGALGILTLLQSCKTRVVKKSLT